MTTSTLLYPRAAAGVAALPNTTERSPLYSLSFWFDVFAKSLAMARVVPDNGPITAKQMEKVRAISETI